MLGLVLFALALIHAKAASLSRGHLLSRKGGAKRWISHSVTTNEATGHEVDTSHDLRLNLTEVKCYTHVKMHPSQIGCPDTCPYLRAEPTRMCEFKCVLPKDCSDDNPLANFANPKTHRCEACLVPACVSCSNSSKHVCAKCHPGFKSVDGKCMSRSRHMWHCFYVVLGVIVLVFIVWVVQLFRRDMVNFEVVKQACDFRYSSSIRSLQDGSQWHLYNTDMRSDPEIAGLGTMLHFRWMFMITVVAFCIMLPLIVLSLIWARRSSLEHLQKLESRHTFNACENNVKKKSGALADMEALFFFVLLGIYVFCTVGSIVYFRWTSAFWSNKHNEALSLGKFSMLAKGFPILSGSEDVEPDFEQFLRASPQLQGLNLIGVSVCWNYGRDRKEDIKAHIKHLTGIQEGRVSPRTIQYTNTMREEARRNRSCFDPELRCIDTAFGIGGLPCGGSDAPDDLPDINEILDGLKTSEYVFVTFDTIADAVQAKQRVDKQPFEYKGSKILLYDHDYEPMTVLWDGWGCPPSERFYRLAQGWVIIFASIVMLDVCFYFPYVKYIMSYSDVSGMTQGGFVTGTALGLLITVCNQIIYAVILGVAESCGWTNTGKQMRFYVIQYTLAVLCNTCVDLWTVILLARGYAVDEAIQFQASNDMTLSPKAIAEQPSIHAALYVQIVAYIFPSCLLLPFLIEPIAGTVAPFYLGMRMVGSHKEVIVQDAEECLACNPYDLSRYGDVLVNVMLCCLMFVFTYPGLWCIWLYFIISMVVIYSWDKLRVLRHSKRSFFASMTMDAAAQYMTTWPCGMMAMCLVFRFYGAKTEGFVNELTQGGIDIRAGRAMLRPVLSAITRNSIPWICFAAFVCHVLIHFGLMRLFSGRGAESGDDSTNTSDELLVRRSMSPRHLNRKYEEEDGKHPDSFFTTNPVHCLRSYYKYEHSPPCVYYSVGKPHLVTRNPKIGINYDYGAHKGNIPSFEKRNKPQSFMHELRRYIVGFGHAHHKQNEPTERIMSSGYFEG